MSAIKAVIFDKDGTLFDFATTWETWAQAFLTRLAGGDATLANQLGQAVGFDMGTASFARDSIVIAGTPDEVAAALAPALPGHDKSALLSILNEEAARAPQSEAVPLVPFLAHLKAMGLHLGVATNDSERPALAHLNAAGVRESFDFVAGSDSGYGAKPAPGQLLGFAQVVGVDPAACAMVGDSLHDLMAARAAGMLAVGVLTGYAVQEELAPFADVVLDSIAQLPEWIAQRAENDT